MIKPRHILPALLLLLVWCVPARAQFASNTLKCNSSSGAGLAPYTCITAANAGSVYGVIFQKYAPGATATISDSNSDTYFGGLATGCNNTKQITYVWYFTANSTGGFTITVNISGDTSTGARLFSWELAGVPSLPANDLDGMKCLEIGSNAATQTSGSITVVAHDGVIAGIVCASGNVGTGEFAPVSPLISGTGENGGSNSSFRGAHIVDFSSSGSQTVQFTSAQGCGTLSTFPIVFVWAAFKSTPAAAPGYPMVIKHSHSPWATPHKIPWDRPRKVIELEKI